VWCDRPISLPRCLASTRVVLAFSEFLTQAHDRGRGVSELAPSISADAPRKAAYLCCHEASETRRVLASAGQGAEGCDLVLLGFLQRERPGDRRAQKAALPADSVSGEEAKLLPVA
jgi:hypothetical protein